MTSNSYILLKKLIQILYNITQLNNKYILNQTFKC